MFSGLCFWLGTAELTETREPHADVLPGVPEHGPAIVGLHGRTGVRSVSFRRESCGADGCAFSVHNAAVDIQ